MTEAASAAVCADKKKVWTQPRVVSVNGVVISRSAIAQEIQNHPAAKPVDAWLSAARALVIRELLLQEAKALAISPAPIADDDGRTETDDEALIRQLITDQVRTPVADESTCRRYFDQNSARFRSPDLFEVRHILLAAAPGDKSARASARSVAAAVIAALESDPSSFAKLAKAHSACPSAVTGGNLGQIGPGQTVPEFESALATLPVGVVGSVPVETRYGVHVVQVERRIDGRALPFDVVRNRIAAWLDESVHRTACRQYIGRLAAAAAIVGVDLGAMPSPLVQ